MLEGHGKFIGVSLALVLYSQFLNDLIRLSLFLSNLALKLLHLGSQLSSRLVDLILTRCHYPKFTAHQIRIQDIRIQLQHPILILIFIHTLKLIIMVHL